MQTKVKTINNQISYYKYLVNDIIKLKVDNSLIKRVYHYAKLYTINQTTKYFSVINTKINTVESEEY